MASTLDEDSFPMDTSTSPQALDANMDDPPQSFQELFFDQAYGADVPLYGEVALSASSFPTSLPPKPQQIQDSAHDTSNENALSISSESQDSSSDSSGRHKRQPSSRSSYSLHTTESHRQNSLPKNSPQSRKVRYSVTEVPQAVNFGASFGAAPGEVETSNRAMEASFDFNSAANTPSPLTSGSSLPRSSFSGRFVTMPQDSPILSAASLHPSLSPTNPREDSPLSQMASSNFRPSTMQTSHASPASSDDYLDMTTLNTKIPSFSNAHPAAPKFADSVGVTRPLPATNNAAIINFGTTSTSFRKTPSQLIIHPTPQKSRVETQIPIKMSLFPVPSGIKRLHLPVHTISKPKLLTRPPPEKQADMLELHTSLVCTSAMRDPAKLQRALDRASGGKSPSAKSGIVRRASTGDGDPTNDSDLGPLEGGEVHICGGCINRERKRAARKKSKKPEEEELWQKDEAKRIIVFNTKEIKEWQEPSTGNPPSEAQGDESSPPQELPPIKLPDGTMQIDIPMRIACYCRHKAEKMGFQVIFTIKDWQGNLIAQTISNAIMITDDHKTHGPPVMSSISNLYDHIALPGGSTIAREPLDNYGSGFHRNAHSTNDLQALQNHFAGPAGQPVIAPYAVPQSNSQTTSTTLTPRNLSRQASPTAVGNCHKKRKGSSGPIRLPDNLQMTRIQAENSSVVPQDWPVNSGLSNSPQNDSPFMPNFPSNVGQMPTTQQPSQFFTSPTSSNNDMDLFGQHNRSRSFENLSQTRGVYSLPNSSHPSRAPSPNSLSQPMQGIATGVTTPSSATFPQNIFGNNFMTGPQRNPVIHKLIPSEGPKAGGIEVTCLGSGFSNGLEIMFGDCLATTTTFWGETSLVCLLPPASRAGTVPVTFKHQYLQMKAQTARFPSQAPPRPHILFKYIDDDEQELLRQALLLLNHKMHGTFGEVSDIARNIVNGANRMGQGSMDSMSGMSGRQHPTGGAFDAETAVLKVLELIDLDDSPYTPRLNMRRKNGQSILHLAASLGMTRLVAGLLARGANPDVRDENGLSPMHMAAINGRAGIIQRLRRARGDPLLRSLRGFTPADMAANAQVLEAIQVLSNNRSPRQGLTLVDRSRSSSFSSGLSRRRLLVEESSYEYDRADESDDEASEVVQISRHATPSQPWARSRQNSVKPTLIEPVVGGSFPAAAMAAWRDSLAAQIQQFQQSVSWNFANLSNLPNLQLPNLPSMPTIPENYQAGSMVRRFSSLVPQRSSSPATSDSEAPRSDSKESVLRVWDLLTGSATPSPGPPAYEEIYPESHTHSQGDVDKKTSSAMRAAADAAADIKCAAMFDDQGSVSLAGGSSVAGSSSATAAASSSARESPKMLRLRHGEVTEEERAALVAARTKQMKKLTSDRKLFLFWIPILLFLVLAVLKNQVPPVWEFAKGKLLGADVAAPAARHVAVEGH